MRELFDDKREGDPVFAARRAARPVRRHRFYKAVTIAAGEAGYGVHLDGKPAYTPHRRPLTAPLPDIAQAVADEWDTQAEHIDPAKMPLTRLANTIIDGVATSRADVAAEIRKYLASDLLFYRAETPAPLRAHQARHWDPVLAWARQTLGADFKIGSGIGHIAQPVAALDAAGAAVPQDEWRLGPLHVATTLTGSALLALALMDGAISPEAAWQAAHVDEDWNMEQWGRDEIALRRRALRLAEFQAAALVLRALGR
jgi:chaperone required for assembly of F1-ATPase